MYKACKIKSRYVVKDPIGPELLLTHKLKYHVSGAHNPGLPHVYNKSDKKWYISWSWLEPNAIQQ